ncbi:uncharacterized protein VP01_13230g1, partial [Puccinia sorghi]
EIPRVRSRPTGAKIRPGDYPGVPFSLEAVDQFLSWYEEAEEVEGANGGDMVCQIEKFIPNEEDLRDMEEMVEHPLLLSGVSLRGCPLRSRSGDGSSLLPDLEEIREAVRAKFNMMELMEETLGSTPQAGKTAGGLRRAEPVTQEEV